MSLFLCQSCHQMSDSDEGCEEWRGKLICWECAEEAAEAELQRQMMTEQTERK